jgi:hypothetical protein
MWNKTREFNVEVLTTEEHDRIMKEHREGAVRYPLLVIRENIFRHIKSLNDNYSRDEVIGLYQDVYRKEDLFDMCIKKEIPFDILFSKQFIHMLFLISKDCDISYIKGVEKDSKERLIRGGEVTLWRLDEAREKIKQFKDENEKHDLLQKRRTAETPMRDFMHEIKKTIA